MRYHGKLFLLIFLILGMSTEGYCNFFSSISKAFSPNNMKKAANAAFGTAYVIGNLVGDGGEESNRMEEGMAIVSKKGNREDRWKLKDKKMGMTEDFEEMSDQFLFVNTGSSRLSIRPHGHYEEQRSMSRESGHDSRGSGITFAGDHRLNKEWVLGAQVGTDLTTSETKDNNNKSHTQSKIGTIHGNWKKNNYFLSFGLSGSWHRLRGGRFITANNSWASQSHEGYMLMPAIGLAYHGKLENNWNFIPFAHSSFVYDSENAYTEEGGGASNARVNRRSSSELVSTVGAGLYKKIEKSGWRGVYGLNLGWNNRLPVKKGNLNGYVGGTSFEESLNQKATNRMVSSLLVKVLDKEGLFVVCQYDGEFGTRYHSHGGMIQVGKRF